MEEYRDVWIIQNHVLNELDPDCKKYVIIDDDKMDASFLHSDDNKYISFDTIKEAKQFIDENELDFSIGNNWRDE